MLLSNKDIGCNLQITTNSKVLSFICDNIRSRLQSSTIDFNKIFGEKKGDYKGSEYILSVWIVPFKEYEFVIFSAEGYGTTYEIKNVDFDQIRSKKVEKVCIEFLTMIKEESKKC